MKLSKKQVEEINQEILCGFNIYINSDTGEIKSIYDIDNAIGDTEIWEEELEHIENNWENFVVITGMDSGEAYEIMEDFVVLIKEEELKNRIMDALNRRKPFAHFKHLVESSDYRESWFEYKNEKYLEYIKEQLEANGIEIDS